MSLNAVIDSKCETYEEEVLLQLRLMQDGGQSVSTDFGLASSVIGAHVAYALLVRVHVLHVVTTMTGQGDLG